MKTFYIFLISLFLLGCSSSIEINTKSPAEFVTSVEKVRNKLPYDQRILFNEAAQRLVLNHKTDGELTFTKTKIGYFLDYNMEDFLPLYANIFKGMTAEQILAADSALSEDRQSEYVQLNMLSDLVRSLDENYKNKLLSEKIVWRGKEITVEELKTKFSDMHYKSEVTLDALGLVE